MKPLIITNGSNSIDLMNAAGIAGQKMSWDDLLHEGPVPAELSLNKLSSIRAEYIADQGWASLEQAQQKFNQRNQTLARYQQYNAVILCFEHDLYDQLQLLQILDWFYQQPTQPSVLRLLCTDKHIGYHTPAEFKVAFKLNQMDLNSTHLALASQGWQAFCSSSTHSLSNFIKQDLSLFKHLKSALSRLIQEYPDSNGLGLTERLILQSLETKPLSITGLFKQYQLLEAAEFMADQAFFSRLNLMAFCRCPLLEFNPNNKIGYPIDSSQQIKQTVYAEQCLQGNGHWFNDNQVERWIGGVKITAC